MFHVELKNDVDYSNELCSAAPSRQLTQPQFIDDVANRALRHVKVLARLGRGKTYVYMTVASVCLYGSLASACGRSREQ
jgi:hypothetical protein